MEQLGVPQHLVVQRSGVSKATVFEIQNNRAQRRRNPRVLEAISVALRLHPTHLYAVLHGLPTPSDHAGGGAAPREARTSGVHDELTVMREKLAAALSSLERIERALAAPEQSGADLGNGG
ncbi:XRE family transcriptional regulator [Actinokineospora enzanensis]|uniref:XRE family transcriptional regulator n=1 Tax=Actinokineospora enzanensis TaxID=155975 RepID=UPI0003A7DAED|nr:XRE family transcriptional regulator [Actinokineospora enzanensis]